MAVLTTVTRNFRESEMVVWFASGLSLKDWVGPVLRCAVPVAVVIAVLTLVASPWAYRQISEYRQRYRSEEHTSELQSLMRISYAVFCLKKKKTSEHIVITTTTRIH